MLVDKGLQFSGKIVRPSLQPLTGDLHEGCVPEVCRLLIKGKLDSRSCEVELVWPFFKSKDLDFNGIRMKCLPFDRSVFFLSPGFLERCN